MKKITIVLPCFGRPERTKRMIECIFNQNINNWEAFIIGDNCRDFRGIIYSQWYARMLGRLDHTKNSVKSFDVNVHYGGYGYNIINYAIKQAKGDYFVFAGNDDIIETNHFEHYLSGIRFTNNDFVYYNTWTDPLDRIRIANLNHGGIGHSELIIRTDFLKKMPEHGPEYGHDWKLIQDMMKATNNYTKIEDDTPTYKVMSVKGKTHDTIN